MSNRRSLASALVLVVAMAVPAAVSSAASAAPAGEEVTLVGQCTPLAIASMDHDAIDIPIAYDGTSSTRSVTLELRWNAATNEDLVIGLEGPADRAAALVISADGSGGDVTFDDLAGPDPELTDAGRVVSSLAPAEPLSVFAGADPAGPWRLIAMNLQEPEELQITGCTLRVGVDGVPDPAAPEGPTTSVPAAGEPGSPTTQPVGPPDSQTSLPAGPAQPSTPAGLPRPSAPLAGSPQPITAGGLEREGAASPQPGILARTGALVSRPTYAVGLILMFLGVVVLAGRRAASGRIRPFPPTDLTEGK